MMQKKCIVNIESIIAQFLMDKMFRAEKKRYYQLCVIVALLLIVSYDSYWFGTSGIAIFERLRNVFILFLPIILFAINYKQKYLQKNIHLLLILQIIVFFSSIMNGNTLGAPLLIFSGMILGVFFEKKYSVVEFFSSFSDVVLAISLYSLIIWLCVNAHILPSTPISNIADAEMTTSYGCVFFPILLGTVIRNSSIFREPGVFMIILNIALIFELFFLNNKYRNLRVGILIATLLSTFSTGGIISGCMIVLTSLFNKRNSVYAWMAVFGIISILAFGFVTEDYMNEIFGKFETIQESGSGFARYSSVLVPLNIFFQHPLLGCGFVQFPAEYERVGYELFNRYIDSKGLATNTFMNVFAIFGGFLGVFMLCGLYKFSKLLSSGRRIYTLLFCLILFLMFSNESMPYFSFLYIFFYYGFNRKSILPTKSL